MLNGKVRVLVVDDSSLVRQILSRGLGMDPGLEVVGTASDPFIARDKIQELDPDVMTLDVEMPRMDGVEFLRRLMPQHPIPVVMVSALTQKGKQLTLEALEAGAVDFVTKPSVKVASGLEAMLAELRTKIKIASTARVSHWKQAACASAALPRNDGGAFPMRALSESTEKIIAIGASTGGTEALRDLLARFPANMPGVVVVQHMPPGFTKLFAERLNDICAMEVKEACDGDRIFPGRALIAPGGMHTRLRRSGGTYLVECRPGEKVSGHCPSVDVLLNSVAEQAGANAVGVILTGMGHDGAEGLSAMRQAGAHTVGQDEASCVVYGMPKAAFERGAVEAQRPLQEVAGTVMAYVDGK